MKARDNPFAAERIVSRVRYRPDGFTWPDLLARLAALNHRAAIVGPHGTGKTTLLEDLVPHLEDRGLTCRTITLRSDQRRLDLRRLRKLGRGDVLLLDGAEQLSAVAWLGVRFRARRAAGLIVTSHRSGRLPTLLETRVSPNLLRGIVADLVDDSTAAAIAPQVLLARHHGNARNVLRGLYDRWGDAGRPGG